MPEGPAARMYDLVAHGMPSGLIPGPGSPNVVIGDKPAWRGVPPAATGPYLPTAIATEEETKPGIPEWGKTNPGVPSPMPPRGAGVVLDGSGGNTATETPAPRTKSGWGARP